MDDILDPLKLACRNCLQNPTNREYYEGLKDTILSIFEWAYENGVDRRFIARHPVFQQAWDLFCSPSLSTPDTQLRSNVVYLTGRLPSF